MHYKRVINGKSIFAGSVEVYVQTAEDDDGFSTGGHSGYFQIDEKSGHSTCHFVVDDNGDRKLFDDPIEAVGAAFVFAKNIILRTL